MMKAMAIQMNPLIKLYFSKNVLHHGYQWMPQLYRSIRDDVPGEVS